MAFQSTRGLIFWREAIRMSRARRTYWMRVLFTLLLTLLLVPFLLTLSSPETVAMTGRMGRTIFAALAFGTIVLTCVLTPVLVIQGSQEEQDPELLSTLATTHLKPGTILWSKVGSRLLVVGTIVIGALPLASGLTYMGGFGVDTVLAWFVSLVLLVVGLGGAAALLSFGTRGIMLPFIATIGFAFWTFIFLPGMMAFTVEGSSSAIPFMLSMSPLFFLVMPEWFGIMPLGYMVIFMVHWFFVGGHLMSNRIDRGPDDKRAIWGGIPGAWAIYALILFVLAFVGNVLFSFVSADSVPIVSHVLVGWCAVYVGGMLYLRIALWGIRRLGFRSVFTWFRDGLRLLGNVRIAPNRKPFRWVGVRGNPVFWREVFTNGNGASSRAWWLFGLLWLGVLFLFLLGEGLRILGDADFGLGMAALAVMMSFICGSLLMTTSVTQERKSGALALLQFSNFSPVRLFGGKVLATVACTAPLWIMGWLFWTMTSVLDRGDLFFLAQLPSWDDKIDIIIPFGGLVSSFLWIGVLHLVVVAWSGWVSTLLSNPRAAWLINMVGTLLLPFSIVFTGILLDYLRTSSVIGTSERDGLMQLVMPLWSTHWPAMHGLTYESLFSIVVWSGVVALPVVMASVRLRRRILT